MKTTSKVKTASKMKTTSKIKTTSKMKTTSNMKTTIKVDVVRADLPLLLARGEMEKLGVMLHLDEDEVEILGQRGSLMITADGLPAVDIRQRREQKSQEQLNPRGNKGGRGIKGTSVMQELTDNHTRNRKPEIGNPPTVLKNKDHLKNADVLKNEDDL